MKTVKRIKYFPKQESAVELLDMLYIMTIMSKMEQSCYSCEINKDNERGCFEIISKWSSEEEYRDWEKSEKIIRIEKVMEDLCTNIQVSTYESKSIDFSKKFLKELSGRYEGLLSQDLVAEFTRTEEDLLRQENIRLEEENLRLQASLQNQKRMYEKQMANEKKNVIEEYVKHILVTLDSIEMGLRYSKKQDENSTLEGVLIDYQTLLEGFELTKVKIEDLLKQNEIEEVDTSGLFNPDIHEAITMVNEENHLDNEILQVVQKGYRQKEKLIRPSLVVVCKNKVQNHG